MKPRRREGEGAAGPPERGRGTAAPEGQEASRAAQAAVQRPRGRLRALWPAKRVALSRVEAARAFSWDLGTKLPSFGVSEIQIPHFNFRDPKFQQWLGVVGFSGLVCNGCCSHAL